MKSFKSFFVENSIDMGKFKPQKGKVLLAKWDGKQWKVVDVGIPSKHEEYTKQGFLVIY